MDSTVHVSIRRYITGIIILTMFAGLGVDCRRGGAVVLEQQTAALGECGESYRRRPDLGVPPYSSPATDRCPAAHLKHNLERHRGSKNACYPVTEETPSPFSGPIPATYLLVLIDYCDAARNKASPLDQDAQIIPSQLPLRSL